VIKIIKKKFQLGLALISVILIITPAYANECIWIPSDIYGESFETQLLTKMVNQHITSLAFSVINGTEVFYAKGFGDQPETDNAYHLNSAVKMITATAVLQLYEDGLISLDDDINDYLPYELKNPYYPSSTITIRHLLSHRSSLMGTIAGFENYWPSLTNGTCTFPSVIYEFFHENGTYYSEENWGNFEPGTGILYSDAAIDISTLILENVTGTSFDTYVTDNILTPLGMTNTRFSAENYSPEKLVVGYNWNIATETNEVMPYLNNSNNPGGGGYFSTVEDMSKFMLAHLNNGEYNGTSILNPTTTELMHTEIETSKIGLLWRVRQVRGSYTYEGLDGGPWAGFYAACFIRESIGIIMLINQGSWDLEQYSVLYGFIADLANKLLTEKTCSEETSYYLLPLISFLAVFTILKYIRKRRD
jgi:CubicO group peptidase (beta-lactamase class C family)